MRCVDTKTETTGLDTFPAALVHQSTMYWQHPHLPWLTLFPRMSKANNGCTLGEAECESLAADWADSFRSLFQVGFIFVFVLGTFFPIPFFLFLLAGASATMSLLLRVCKLIHCPLSSGWYWRSCRNSCIPNPHNQRLSFSSQAGIHRIHDAFKTKGRKRNTRQIPGLRE